MGGDARDPRDQVGVDPTGPAVATEGGDALDDVHPPEQQRGSGAHVTGPAPADAEPAHPVWGYPFPGAGPPDLDHAIQAAAGALQLIYDWEDYDVNDVASVVLRAAAPVLLHATRDRLANLEVLRHLLQDVVNKATPFGEVLDEPGGPYVMHYLLPTGPIHRALAYLRDGAIPAALDGPAAQEDGDQACDACGGLFTHDPQCGYLADSHRDGTEGRQ